MAKKRQVARASGGKLRIIGGEWRSRQLQVVDLPGLRPTTDRVRETLFNWLQNDVPGAHCLDLFAGSGALGFEAASRGAASVTLLELQARAADVLADNIQALKADNIRLLRQDALAYLGAAPAQVYDIVFIDPPFDSDYLAPVCERLEQGGWLAPEACIYIEMDSHDELPRLPDGWEPVRAKKAGHVGYYLIRRQTEADD